MTYKAIHVGEGPIRYFLDPNDHGPLLQIADVMLHANQDSMACMIRKLCMN